MPDDFTVINLEKHPTKDILDKHINANETVDVLIDSKKHIQCSAMIQPIKI